MGDRKSYPALAAGSVVLFVAIVLFTVVVLWLDWRLQLKQSDDALIALQIELPTDAVELLR